MKKLKFRLERIRKYKEQIEDDRKRYLAVTQNKLNEEKTRLSAIIETRDRYMAVFGVRSTGKINMRELILSKRHLDKLSADIVMQTKAVKLAEQEVNKAQKALIEAVKERKKYEKLKEKQLENHRKENLLSENKELDEYGSRPKRNALSHNYQI
ncbi:MAG: flagellar export protein FliJ [candidate division Zixibacteria bacterium]|jgi:flagellar FliJ protein|nr:flagellar export protein FliJ [candidate division Zixibacteria bacterium]